jgi:hypothetical protein
MLDGQVPLEFLTSMLRTQSMAMAYGIEVDFLTLVGDQFLSKGRNYLLGQFMAIPEATHLFFIDSDQGWNPEAFVRMALDPHEIVAGVVPKKTDETLFNNPILDADAEHNLFVENNLFRAVQIGTGFMRIARTAVEKMIAAYPNMYAPGDGSGDMHYEIFEAGVIDEGSRRRFWGEDTYFCRKWVALGEWIWIDPDVDFAHAGRKAWKGNFLHYLRQHAKVIDGPKPAAQAAE